MAPRKTSKRTAVRSLGSTADAFAKIYAVIERIPPGRVATYGQVAILAGLPRRARLVGAALRETPEGLSLPWQRVIKDFWLRRSALLALLLPRRRRLATLRPLRRPDAGGEGVLRPQGDRWVLREVAKKDPDRVRKFLGERPGRVSGVTRREAERYL